MVLSAFATALFIANATKLSNAALSATECEAKISWSLLTFHGRRRR